MIRVAVPLVLVMSALAAGCGPTCQTTCNRLYATTGDNCGIQRPGTDQGDLTDHCMEECEDALARTGELEGYDPDEWQGSSSSVELENDKQAAVWMDCIVETACEDLEKGHCAPVW